ncbi:hypothetical protein H4S14_002161 [Agrobacterium vitis]|nr:hypothetical protein [Agrobacterium vitis]MBE1438414.1 hypothetical protein [Agrobacterium vitis]
MFENAAGKRVTTRKNQKYRIDRENGRLHLGSFAMPFPQSRAGRVSIGIGLILGGCLGFLPILGFWMVPVGIVVLSHDVSAARRFRRRAGLKMARWNRNYGRWRHGKTEKR